jgi:hypothetical protein
MCSLPHGVCVTVSRRAVIDKESCCMMMSGEDSLAVLLVLLGQGLMQIYYFLRAPNEDLGYARARDRSAVRCTHALCGNMQPGA